MSVEKCKRCAELEKLLKEMFKADDDYGCGFYGEDTWIEPYEKLRKLVGMYDDDYL